MDEKEKVVVIAGPTASGKSALAVKLALLFQGEIVSADSMQVYRGMDVGTAKPTPEQRTVVPHHLLDVVDPDEDFDAARYRVLALKALQDIAGRGNLGFVVGGTGLYIRSLLGGLIPCPSKDEELRSRLEEEWQEEGGSVLYGRLERLDPDAAKRIHPNDRVRVLRALEIIHLTGRPLSTAVRDHGFGEKSFRALKICLQMKRDRLYHRIDERCLTMAEQGLIAETEDLLRKGFSPDLKSMKALGYRHMVQFLQKGWDLETAIRQLQADTRRYAKRQLTWFRADPEMIRFCPEEENGMVERIGEFLSEPGSLRGGL